VAGLQAGCAAGFYCTFRGSRDEKARRHYFGIIILFFGAVLAVTVIMVSL